MAMERFIRQKYQERSLADGKPRPPSRDEVILPARSPQPSPQMHIQPSKKSKIFGFKLRASSSAYPASKRDTRNLPPLEPTFENAFRSEVHANKPSKPHVSDGSERDVEKEEKLATLREMGFPDNKRNSAVLNRLSGDLSRTVESLVRLGEGSDSRKATPVGSGTSTPSRATFPDNVKAQGGQEPTASNNPFDRPNRSQTLSVPQLTGHQSVSYNPFDVPTGPHSAFQPMDQAFQAMQITQPLFPHSTGGYPQQQPPVQDLRFQHSMTPPVPQISQQYGYATSPSTMYNMNPFLQSRQPQSMAIYEPHQSGQLNGPFSAPPTNPFFSQQSAQQSAQLPPQSAPLQTQITMSNPFGIPPSPQSPQSAPANQLQHSAPFDIRQALPISNAPQQSFYPQQDPQSHFQPPSQGSIPTSQQQMPYQQSNPYQSQFQPQTSPQYQSQLSPLRPQPTGRFDKNSILALYNYPHLAPQPMPTIPDDPTPSSEAPPSYPPAAMITQPSNPDISPNNTLTSPRRSVTMPISAPLISNPAIGVGSRNPFLNSSTDTSRQSSAVTSPAPAQPPMASNSIMHRHASQESVSISNLESGRHSPGAFANLSARFVR